MKRRTHDNALDDLIIENQDLIDIAIGKYSMEFPTDHEIEQIVSTLAQYVPAIRSGYGISKIFALYRVVMSDMVFTKKTYWLVCALIFTIGYFINSSGDSNPLVISMMLAPIPFVLGLIKLQGGRDAGTIELELACKLSAQTLMLTKITMIGLFSVLMNSLLSIAFYESTPGINIWQLTFFWLTPLTLISSMALLISMVSRSRYNVALLTVLWLLAALVVQLDPRLVDYLTSINMTAYAIMVTIGSVVVAYEIKQFAKHYHLTIERFDFNAVNN